MLLKPSLAPAFRVCFRSVPFLFLLGFLLALGGFLFARESKPEAANSAQLEEEPTIAGSGGIENHFQPYFGHDEDIHLDKTPPRLIMGLDLNRMGWTYNCMECHTHVEDIRYHREQKFEHENINLEHGNNRYCLNCHHPDNRNAFVDYDGSEIAEPNVTLLCAKCHGPKYRDWKAGVHGRKNGYWDLSQGIQYKLHCIQCHDPHSPAFKPMKPLPPPLYPSRAPAPKH